MKSSSESLAFLESPPRGKFAFGGSGAVVLDGDRVDFEAFV
jgi:hypothetical protein